MKMDPARHKALWWTIVNQARTAKLLLQLQELRDLRDDFGTAEAMFPFVDPTAFMRDADKVQLRKDLLDATISYVAAIEKLAALELDHLKLRETAEAEESGDLA